LTRPHTNGDGGVGLDKGKKEKRKGNERRMRKYEETERVERKMRRRKEKQIGDAREERIYMRGDK
jgi:hypothetical protein